VCVCVCVKRMKKKTGTEKRRQNKRELMSPCKDVLFFFSLYVRAYLSVLTPTTV
jgi:hypothetical protein